jgi:hypothetical protein
MHVEFDQLRGEVSAGGVTASCSPTGHRGALRVGGAFGPLVAPVTFGERTVVAADALAAPQRRASLCGGLRLRATIEVGAGPAPPVELLDCVVLALAGADDERAPSFADTALSVLRATGGELSSLLDAPAREVDRLAVALLCEPEELRTGLGDDTLELGAVRDRLADALLFRTAAAAAAGRDRAPGVVVPFPATDEPVLPTWEPEPEMPPAGDRFPARALGPVAPASGPATRDRAQRAGILGQT